MSTLAYIQRNIKYARPHLWGAGAKAFYRRLFRSGVLFSSDDLGMCSLLPTKKLDLIIELTKPHSVLDVGCGTGKTIEYLTAHEIDALGIEASQTAIKNAMARDLILRRDLRKPFSLERTFDLVWCFEVAEHIHPRYVDVFLGNLVRHSTIVAMSAAPPGQGGEGHFNEQPQSYWEAQFAPHRYQLHRDWTLALQSIPEFYSQNMMVFIR